MRWDLYKGCNRKVLYSRYARTQKVALVLALVRSPEWRGPDTTTAVPYPVLYNFLALSLKHHTIFISGKLQDQREMVDI